MTNSKPASEKSSGTSHERGERVLAKIAAQWNKNNKSISAAITAASEIGMLIPGQMVHVRRRTHVAAKDFWWDINAFKATAALRQERPSAVA